MATDMSNTAKAAKLAQDRRFFEQQNLFTERNGKASTMAQVRQGNARQGYDAFRVSPATMSRNGKKYRKVYGAVVERVYSSSYGIHYKVNWYENGVVRASVKSGTRMTYGTIPDIVGNNKTQQNNLKSQLMIPKRKGSLR